MPGGPAVGPLPAIAEYLSARTAAERQEVQEKQSAAENPALAMPSKPVDREKRADLSDDEAERDILDLLKSKGVPVGDIAVQGLMPMLIDQYRTAPDLFQTTTAFLTEQVRAPITSAYETIATRTGFPTTFDQAQAIIDQTPSYGSEYGVITGQMPTPTSQTVNRPGQFETSGETGAIRYANGVIADPSTGEVAFPPTEDTPGSALWFNNVVLKWGPDTVKTWKKKLVTLGFLPKEVLKGKNAGVVDQSFKDALLGGYWQNYYLNYGNVVEQDALAGGTGGQDSITNLQAIHQGIENDVAGFYRDLYGMDASKAELDNWTQQVIRMGNRLQRAKDLDPGTAATEAKARVTDRILNSPEGNFFTENMEENTRLRDMIVRSVQVASGMSG